MMAIDVAGSQRDQGWTVYDDLAGSRLDEDLWRSGSPPLPEGGHAPSDPNTELLVSDGEVCVTIPRFSLSHGSFQPADNVKFLMLSRPFALPSSGPAVFGADMAVKTLGGSPLDIRFGMASLNVVDESTGLVFDIGGTSTRAFAIYEALEFAVGRDAAFTYAIESPFVDFDDDFTSFRACEVVLDRGRGSADWIVDGHSIYRHENITIPEQAKIGFGLFTLAPVRAGASQSLQGQGLQGRWRSFRFKGATLADQ